MAAKRYPIADGYLNPFPQLGDANVRVHRNFVLIMPLRDGNSRCCLKPPTELGDGLVPFPIPTAERLRRCVFQWSGFYHARPMFSDFVAFRCVRAMPMTMLLVFLSVCQAIGLSSSRL